MKAIPTVVEISIIG